MILFRHQKLMKHYFISITYCKKNIRAHTLTSRFNMAKKRKPLNLYYRWKEANSGINIRIAMSGAVEAEKDNFSKKSADEFVEKDEKNTAQEKTEKKELSLRDTTSEHLSDSDFNCIILIENLKKKQITWNLKRSITHNFNRERVFDWWYLKFLSHIKLNCFLVRIYIYIYLYFVA